MAVFDAILVPAKLSGVRATLNTLTASSAITPGKGVIFAFNADQVCSLTFGLSASLPDPTGTVGFQVPANSIVVFDLGTGMDSFKIYNHSGSTANYSWMALSKF